jgi:hypothetical protein
MIDPDEAPEALLQEIAAEWDAHPGQGHPTPYLRRKRRVSTERPPASRRYGASA